MSALDSTVVWTTSTSHISYRILVMSLRLRVKTTTITLRPRRRVSRRCVYSVNPRRNIPANPRRGVQRNIQQPLPNRAPLPSINDNPYFWKKIENLPPNLRIYLNPDFNIQSLTSFNLRQLIWHFQPDKRIVCRTRKAALLDMFESNVAQPYGMYYGI